MTANQDLLSVMAFFSALLHAIIILGVSFKLPDIASIENTNNVLDVVLLNSFNDEIPTNAKTVSTSNAQGGGNDDQEASSPLPYKPVNFSSIESIRMVAEQQTETTLAADQLMAVANAEIQIQRIRPNDSKLLTPPKQTGNDRITTKSNAQLERERLIAKINRSMEDYQKRPNKKYLSPSTREHEAAKYLDDWRKKVERVGNANYPAQAKARSLTGTLIITVEIKRNGTIHAIMINNPSPHKILNDSAMRFVRDASPFSSFPDEINANIDVLVITRTFHFLNTNRLLSTDGSSYL